MTLLFRTSLIAILPSVLSITVVSGQTPEDDFPFPPKKPHPEWPATTDDVRDELQAELSQVRRDLEETLRAVDRHIRRLILNQSSAQDIARQQDAVERELTYADKRLTAVVIRLTRLLKGGSVYVGDGIRFYRAERTIYWPLRRVSAAGTGQIDRVRRALYRLRTMPPSPSSARLVATFETWDSLRELTQRVGRIDQTCAEVLGVEWALEEIVEQQRLVANELLTLARWTAERFPLDISGQ